MHSGTTRWHTVDGSEIRKKPVEKVNIPVFTVHGFIHVGWRRISSINSIIVNLKMATEGKWLIIFLKTICVWKTNGFGEFIIVRCRCLSGIVVPHVHLFGLSSAAHSSKMETTAEPSILTIPCNSSFIILHQHFMSCILYKTFHSNQEFFRVEISHSSSKLPEKLVKTAEHVPCANRGAALIEVQPLLLLLLPSFLSILENFHERLLAWWENPMRLRLSCWSTWTATKKGLAKKKGVVDLGDEISHSIGVTSDTDTAS